MPPVSRWSCGATRVYVALSFFTFQIDYGSESADSRRSLLPLYIKTQKMSRSSHRENFVGVFFCWSEGFSFGDAHLEDRPAPGL